jgi:hypothetical protein
MSGFCLPVGGTIVRCRVCDRGAQGLETQTRRSHGSQFLLLLLLLFCCCRSWPVDLRESGFHTVREMVRGRQCAVSPGQRRQYAPAGVAASVRTSCGQKRNALMRDWHQCAGETR